MRRSSKEQIQVISDNVGLWSNSIKECMYAVTDLDQNGRLEIVSSFFEGSVQYSSNSFYEGNEALDGLIV